MLLRRAIRSLLLPLALIAPVVGALALAPPARAAETESPDGTFRKALALFDGKSYGAARDGFVDYRDAIEEAGGDLRAPRYVEAIYYEAECLYLDGDKFHAHELYKTLLEHHREFPRLGDVINREYEVGSAFVEGKATKPLLFLSYKSESSGVEILEYLIERYQQKYFDYAQYQVADYYFRQRDWRRAADAYLALEENFRGSPWAGVAQYQRALCYLSLSRGYRYDATPVMKAEEVLLDYVKKNPTGSRVREAEKALEGIRADRASLYAENVRFYLYRERRPRAALVYVEAMLRDTPDARAARDLPHYLDAIAGRAAERDPATSALAKEMLAEVDRRKVAPRPAPGTPPALVPPGPVSGAKK